MRPESPFACRFGTNFQPTPEERKQIHQIISTALNEQKRIDSLIHDLTIQRDALQQHIEKHQKLAPPIHRVPVEIIQKIFYCCLPSDRNAIMSAHEAPLLLGHVCSAWQKISHSTPHLWSTIHINNPDTYSVSFGKLYCEAIEAWLHRSSALPLSISLVGYYGNPDLLQKLVDVLVRFSPRWKYLALKLRSYESLSSMKAVNPHLLTAVTIDIKEEPDEKALDALSCLHTPSLRAISLGYMSAFPLIQCKNLTHLSVGSPGENYVFTVEEVFEIFRASPNLVSCRFQIAFDDSFEPDIINLPCLNVLHLVVYILDHRFMTSIANFLGALDTPNVSHLFFETQCVVTPTVSFKLLLNRLQSLTTLDYTVSSVPVDEIAAALALSPSVRHLRLAASARYGNSYLGSSLSCALLALLQAHTQHPLLPALEHLDISTDETSDVTEDALLQFILSRTVHAPAGMARLRRIRFAFARPRPSNTDIMPALSSAIARGLRVQIIYRDAPSPVPKPAIQPRNELALAAQAGWWERGFWESDL